MKPETLSGKLDLQKVIIVDSSHFGVGDSVKVGDPTTHESQIQYTQVSRACTTIGKNTPIKFR